MKQSNEIFNFYPVNEMKSKSFIGILSIPHSGEVIPSEFNDFLIDDIIKLSRDVDTGVHQLVDIQELNDNGIAVIKSNIHRIAVDLNRKSEDSVLNWEKNSHGEKVVIKRPDQKTNELLIHKYHSPYYEMLKALIYELENHQKTPSFVDLHSMPSVATDYHLKINPNQSKLRPDFCLSDVEGQTCKEEFIKSYHAQLAKLYANVTINNPYFGGAITREINNMFPEINNIQIEISRALYLDEKTRELVPYKVVDLKEKLTKSLVNAFKEMAN